MYKAIQEIGGYKVGDEVPAEKAITWLKMYAKPPVEEIGEDGEVVSKEEKKSEPEEEKKSEPEDKPVEKDKESNFMLDDYLSRNSNVVKKNIEEDELSQKQLENLLELEKSDKKRKVVIKALKKKLKN